MRHLNKISILLLVVCILSGCVNNTFESKEPDEVNTYDLCVDTSLGSYNFEKLQDTEVYSFYINKSGYLYINNKSNASIALEIKNKITYVKTTYIIGGYAEEIMNIYDSGDYLVNIYINYKDGNYDTVETQSIHIDSIENDKSLGISYYTNPSGVEELLNSEINYINTIDGEDFIDKLFKYLSNFEYNYELAEIIQNNPEFAYKTNFEDCIESKSGICLDTASLGVTLLRLNKIPARLVFGYYNGEYHSWIEYLKDNEWFIMDSVRDVNIQMEYMQSYKTEKYF